MKLIHVLSLFVAILCANVFSSQSNVAMMQSECKELDDTICAKEGQSSLNLPDIWNLNEVNEVEKSEILEMKRLILEMEGEHGSWLQMSTDIDKLRFLRQAHGSLMTGNAIKRAIDSMAKHSRWRESPDGATYIYREMKDEFENHILNDEFYWIGPSLDDGCPTLVVRSQLHDGVHYNEDAKYFVKYVTYMMEKGAEMYGIGPEREFCMVVDRTDATTRNGAVKKDTFDLSVVPQIVDLLKTVYSVLWPNYPKVLKRAQVLPSSWFFASCWTVARRFLDPSISNKFEIIQEKHITNRLMEQFHPELLPSRFGGSAEDFIPDRRPIGTGVAGAQNVEEDQKKWGSNNRVYLCDNDTSSSRQISGSNDDREKGNDTNEDVRQPAAEPTWIDVLAEDLSQ